MVGFLVVSGFFVLLAVLSALGWVADSREQFRREPTKWFGAPYD